MTLLPPYPRAIAATASLCAAVLLWGLGSTVPGLAGYPTPPPQQNVYERTAHRGIWDYNFTDAKSGLFWTIPDSKDSTGKAGTDKYPPDYPRIHYPTEMFVWATFEEVEQLEQRVILSAKNDPTRVPISITTPITDMYGRHIPVGVYAVALRQANPNPPSTIAELNQGSTSAAMPPRYHAGMYDDPSPSPPAVVQGQASANQVFTTTRVVYPQHDITRQTQQNPFFLHNPRLDAGGGPAGTGGYQGQNAAGVTRKGKVIPLQGNYLVIKRQGVVKGVLPVDSVQRYQPQKGQKKSKMAFAAMSHNGQPGTRVALFYKSKVYQATPSQQQLPVDYPTRIINNDTDSINHQWP